VSGFCTRKTDASWPQSIFIVGCGLIGMSLAKALRRVLPDDTLLDGLEPNPSHRQMAEQTGVFQRLLSTLPASGDYDLIVLAVPVDAACALLQPCAALGQWLMDVCSVKSDICRQAADLGLRGRFFPSHPMAGLASEGPAQAVATLFCDRPWIGIAGWDDMGPLIALLEAIGAQWRTVPNPEVHDAIMARVSHSIHLTSLAAMLSFAAAEQNVAPAASDFKTALFCGPAFTDITRLAASPPGFWTSTLLANRKETVRQLHRTVQELETFIRILETEDRDALWNQLDSARRARQQWEDSLGGSRET